MAEPRLEWSEQMGSDPEFSKNLIANEIGPSNISYDSSILLFTGMNEIGLKPVSTTGR